jgi:hypothetical protein
MCVPVLLFRQKQKSYSAESISNTFIWTLLAHGEWRRAFVELHKVETTQKKMSRESRTIFWSASFKTNVLEKVNLKMRTDPVPTT